MQTQERNGTPIEMRSEENFLAKIFKYLFYVQFLLITVLEFYLIVHGVSSASQTHHFQPKQWYLPVLSSTACAGIIGFVWQEFTCFNPSRAFKAAFCLSPLLTCAYGILLVYIGTPGSSAAAVFALASSVFQSLYACSVDICLYSLFCFFDVWDWGSHCCWNKAQYSVHIPEPRKLNMGAVLGVIRGSARAISLVPGDVDEFLFSCANCCSGVAERLVAYGNRWGFVQVGVYNKGIVQASMDTWEMFRRIGIERLINTDLTSSFCFLCGIATGSICALAGGSWALVIHKTYATEVSLYTFLTGYIVSRVAMAWIQASVAAYYVAYAENPQSQQFDRTIPDYIQALQRLQG